MELPSKKIINLIGAISCLGLILFALYSEHILLLEPCPLCVLQRIAVIALGSIFLIAFIHNPNKITSRIYVFLCILISSFGAATAAWHVHLQNLPADEIPSCGPGLGYMIENLPLKDIFGMILQGSGECAEESWNFIGLSMPAWVIVSMIFLGSIAAWNNLRS